MAMMATHTRIIPALGLKALFRAIANKISLHHQRARLITLDDQQLRDIGVSYKQAFKEGRRPVWVVPSHWQRPNM